MKWTLSIGAALVVAGAAVLLLQITWLSIALIAAGVVVLLAAAFRRYGRPGDFRRSGWTGQ